MKYYVETGGDTMTFKELREQSGMSRTRFAEYFGIPYRTIQNWELELRECPEYLLDLMEYKLNSEKHRADLIGLHNYLTEHEDTDTALMQNAGLSKYPTEILEGVIGGE